MAFSVTESTLIMLQGSLETEKDGTTTMSNISVDYGPYLHALTEVIADQTEAANLHSTRLTRATWAGKYPRGAAVGLCRTQVAPRKAKGDRHVKTFSRCFCQDFLRTLYRVCPNQLRNSPSRTIKRVWRGARSNRYKAKFTCWAILPSHKATPLTPGPRRSYFSKAKRITSYGGKPTLNESVPNESHV